MRKQLSAVEWFHSACYVDIFTRKISTTAAIIGSILFDPSILRERSETGAIITVKL